MAAAAPEGLIALVLLGGAAALAFTADHAWTIAFGATLLSALVTLDGFSVTLQASRPGDVAYRVVVLAALAWCSCSSWRQRLDGPSRATGDHP